jgi:PTS system nitrogen regulatory IIA component
VSVSVAAILSPERVGVLADAPGRAHTKDAILERVSELLARGATSAADCRAPSKSDILRVLLDRERMQSTGVGLGVAIPHGTADGLIKPIGALLVCRPAVPFDAIDGRPVSVVFALLGPKGAAAQHLKLLARVARLLRDEVVRSRLMGVETEATAYSLVLELERVHEGR